MSYMCNTCKSINVTEEVMDTAADNVPAEISYKCKDCGESAYYAYGKYESNYFPFVYCDGRLNFTLAQAKDLIARMKESYDGPWSGLDRVAEQMTELVDRLTTNKAVLPPATCGCDSYPVTWSKGKNGSHICSTVLPNSIMVFGHGVTPEEALAELRFEAAKCAI
jgi:hypothetical protein